MLLKIQGYHSGKYIAVMLQIRKLDLKHSNHFYGWSSALNCCYEVFFLVAKCQVTTYFEVTPYPYTITMLLIFSLMEKSSNFYF